MSLVHVKRSEDGLSHRPTHPAKRPEHDRSAGLPQYLRLASRSSDEAEAHRAADQVMSSAPLAPARARRATDGATTTPAGQGRGAPLEPATRAFMEARFGEDFGDVRTHTDGDAERAAVTIGARAYTVGNDITFDAGEYSPGSREGQWVLAHELAHVVQQQPAAQQKTAGLAAGLTRGAPHTPQLLSSAASVTEFKKVIDNPVLVQKGQFYWSFAIREELESAFEREWTAWFIASGLTYFAIPPPPAGLLEEALDLINAAYDAAKSYSKKRAALEKKLVAAGAPAKPMLKLMGDGSKHGTGGTLSAELWKRYHNADAVPDFEAGGFLRVDVLHALSLIEPSMCLSTADDVVELFYARGGFPGTARAKGTNMPPSSTSSHVVTVEPQTDPYPKLGDIAIGSKNLPGVLATLRTALDDGHLVHARVLSGAYGPSDEHSLIVLGYTGNGFAFWDPDSSQSATPETGFGKLFFFDDSGGGQTSGPHFSTAENAAELPVSSGDGMHVSPSSQHRYQVLRLTPF